MNLSGKFVHELTAEDLNAMSTIDLFQLRFFVVTFAQSIHKEWLTDSQRQQLGVLMDGIDEQLILRNGD